MVRRLLHRNKHKLQGSKARQKRDDTPHTMTQKTCSEFTFDELYKKRPCKPRLNHIIIRQHSSPAILNNGGNPMKGSNNIMATKTVTMSPTVTNMAPRTVANLEDKQLFTVVRPMPLITVSDYEEPSRIATPTTAKTNRKMATTQPVIIKMVASSTNRHWGPHRERITKLSKRQQCQRFCRRTKVILSCLEGNTDFLV